MTVSMEMIAGKGPEETGDRSGTEQTAARREDSEVTTGPKIALTPPTPWEKRRGLVALLAVMREDRVANLGERRTQFGDWLVPAVQALTVYRFGQWVDSEHFPRLLRKPASALYNAMFIMVRNLLGIELPSTVELGRRVRFVHQHGVVIHPYATIGDDCIFRHGVTIGARSAVLWDAPHIGSGVTFAVGSAVMGPVTIGDGAIVGPNAVVTTDVPAGASVVAPPSRVLRLNRSQG